MPPMPNLPARMAAIAALPEVTREPGKRIETQTFSPLDVLCRKPYQGRAAGV